MECSNFQNLSQNLSHIKFGYYGTFKDGIQNGYHHKCLEFGEQYCYAKFAGPFLIMR